MKGNTAFWKGLKTIAKIKDLKHADIEILAFIPLNLVCLSSAEDSYIWQYVVGYNTSVQVVIPIPLNPRKTTSRCWAVDSGKDFFFSVF